MEPANESPKNILAGKWKIVTFYAKRPDKSWRMYKRYGNNVRLWEFTEGITINFYTGAIAYEGELIEIRKKWKDNTTEYAYYVDEQELYIDRSAYAEDGFCEACVNQKYRVVPINPDELWLYILEDVKNEPEDYVFRVKIKRRKY